MLQVVGPRSCSLGRRRGEHGDRCCTVTSCSFICLQTTTGVGTADFTNVPLDEQRRGVAGPSRCTCSALCTSSVGVLQGCCSRYTRVVIPTRAGSLEAVGTRTVVPNRLRARPRHPVRRLPACPLSGPRALVLAPLLCSWTMGAGGFPLGSVVSSHRVSLLRRIVS